MITLTKEISYRLRASLLAVLSPLTVSGVTIPIFDQTVNPSATIPTLNGAKVYMLINSQTNTETTNDKCQIRLDANINFDVVTKFPPNTGGSITSELIGQAIMEKIDRALAINDFQLLQVSQNFNQGITEQATSETVYRKILSYRFECYQH